MPELPEVEALRRDLEDALVPERLESVTLYRPEIWGGEPGYDNPHALEGRTLEAVSRRGKYLIFHFSGDRILIVHLRMTGQLLLRGDEDPVRDHTHVIFRGTGGRLDFRDVRRFGRLESGRADTPWLTHHTLARLGPEPTAETLSLQDLRQAAKRHRGLSAKAFLLNQTVIAGIGNIYADEILHRASIHPARLVRQLKPAQWRTLHASILAVIALAVDRGGTSFRDYRHADGSRGNYLEVAAVYGRAGQPCLTCGSELLKGRVAGRGTVYCPQCQKPPRGFRPR